MEGTYLVAAERRRAPRSAQGRFSGVEGLPRGQQWSENAKLRPELSVRVNTHLLGRVSGCLKSPKVAKAPCTAALCIERQNHVQRALIALDQALVFGREGRLQKKLEKVQKMPRCSDSYRNEKKLSGQERRQTSMPDFFSPSRRVQNKRS